MLCIWFTVSSFYFHSLHRYLTIVYFHALGVENSFPKERECKKFYQKYYQLLLHGKFPMKEPKLMLVGAADSGKTSWFYPFQGAFNSVNCCYLLITQMFHAHHPRARNNIEFKRDNSLPQGSYHLITLPVSYQMVGFLHS